MANPPVDTIAAPQIDEASNNVDFVRHEVAAKLSQYSLISDCIDGQEAIKARGIVYLPMPNPSDTSNNNLLRYAAYKNRAVFYGVTGRTLSGLLGQVFNVEPVIKVPALLDAVVKDANGAGIPLSQLAQEVEGLVLAYGRAGLFVDYPQTKGKPTTMADLQSGNVRPNIISYLSENIINWRTVKRGGELVLTLIVLREKYESDVGDYGISINVQYRVLKLTDNKYNQEVFRQTSGGWTSEETGGNITPLDSAGNPFSFIPFTFVGAINNDIKIDNPPLYDLAALNIAHYRNSADYEDSVYLVGQPTPILSGLTKDWVDNVLKGSFELGSRGSIPLPVGASASLLQAQENGLVKEAMADKERQMVALGAKLVEQKTVQRTATEAGLEEASEVSVLATITRNVSAAFKFALEVCSLFVGSTTIASDANNDTIVFSLNTEFALASATPDELRATVELWQKAAITFSEMRASLRRNGQATLDDKKAKTEIETEQAREIAFTNANTIKTDNEDFGNGNIA